MVLSPGGDLVLRLHTSYTRFTSSLLLLCSLCFCFSGLYKPPSSPPWCTEAFFIGRERRQTETGLVLQLLSAAWNMLAAANKKDRDLRSNADTNEATKMNIADRDGANSHMHLDGPAINFGGFVAEWVLQQCIKSKLFTDLFANR